MSHAPVTPASKGLFTKEWYLFFQGLFNSIAAPPASSSGLDYYTIWFGKQGFLISGENVPSFIVAPGREGVISGAWVFGQTAPTGVPASINFTVNGVNAYSSDLVLPLTPIGNGVVFAAVPASYAFRLIAGYIVNLKVTVSGSISGFSAGLVIKRTAS